MNNHLAPANFIETRDLPKITHKVPIIEGLDMNEEIEKSYTDANEIIPKNIAYLKCASENENHCNVLQNTMNEKEISLNALTDLRNKSTLDYETCDTQLKSCQMLYNDLNTKTQEFKNIYDEINKLEKTETTETIFTNVSEKYRSFVLIGLIFFIIEIIARKTIFKSFV